VVSGVKVGPAGVVAAGDAEQPWGRRGGPVPLRGASPGLERGSLGVSRGVAASFLVIAGANPLVRDGRARRGR
jgi:hypothetical protein